MESTKYYNEHFEANLERLMAERKITGKELAEKAFCSESAFNNYKKGRRPLSTETLDAIAVALGVTQEELLGPRTLIDNEIEGVSRSISRSDLSDAEQARYADATYQAIPSEQSKRILTTENAKREVGEYIVSHPKAYFLITILTFISAFVFIAYPEPHSKVYSGIIMCGLAMLIGKSIKKPKKIDCILDVFLWIVMILLIVLFVGLGIKAAIQ